jgi:hypothetical protein
LRQARLEHVAFADAFAARSSAIQVHGDQMAACQKASVFNKSEANREWGKAVGLGRGG